MTRVGQTKRHLARNHHKTLDGMKRKMSDAKKRDYLDKLPKHKMSQASERARFFDVGTLRPWGVESIRYLLDSIRAGDRVIDIAFMARRDPDDTAAIYRIAFWMNRQQVAEDKYHRNVPGKFNQPGIRTRGRHGSRVRVSRLK